MAKNINEKQKEILARKLGYDGPMNMFEQFVKSDPAMERKYGAVIEKYMARGGMVRKYAEGGAVTPAAVDFSNLDYTQYPMSYGQQQFLNRNLIKLNEAQNNLNQLLRTRATPGREWMADDTALAGAQQTLDMLKNESLAVINQGALDLNKAMANYIVAAGSGDKAAALQNLENTFRTYNAEVPEKLKDPEYVDSSYKAITDVANSIPSMIGGVDRISLARTQPAILEGVATAYLGKTDLPFTGTTSKENIVKQHINLVVNGPDNIARQFSPAFDRSPYIASDYRYGAALAEGFGSALVRSKLEEPPKYASAYRDEMSNILAMAQGQKKPDLAYDIDKDGKVTFQDAIYYNQAQDASEGGRVSLDQAAAFAQQELRKKEQPAPAAPVTRPGEQRPTGSSQLPDWVVPPPPGSATTSAMEELINPITGEKFLAPSGGYTVRPDLAGQAPIGTAPTVGGSPTVPLQPPTGIPIVAPISPIAPTTPVGTGTPTPSQPVPEGTPVTPISEASPVTGTVTTPTAPGVGSVSSPLTSPVSPAPLPQTGSTTPPIESVTAPGQEFEAGTSGPLPEQAPGMTNVPQIDTALIQPTQEQMLSTASAPTAATTAIPQMATGTAQVADIIPRTAATVGTTFSTPAVGQALTGLQPALGTVSEQAQVQAATMEPTSTAVGDLQAAQGVAGTVQGAPTRTLQGGELIGGPTVDQEKIEQTLQANEAAQGVVTEDMTVQGQLSKLTADFEAGNPPAWAAASMRNANAILSQRGLGASSLAGQAIIQATLEAALPIAAADAQTYREMGIQNLSNKQQMAVITAQQRAAFLGQEFDQAFQTRTINAATISQIANVNFSAQQQIALENARLAETVNLANLSNRQALVMAEAAQIATLETANLNNRQQANVLNAQAFLQMDLTNLNNQQQTAMFKAQSMVQSILSDAAADNAAKQFNASSINQVNQFYDGLSSQIKQFNATQTNAMNQFNVGQLNSIAQFNAGMQNQRDQFNAEFRKVIDQSNAEWRRNIALQNTSAINRANEFNATAALGVTTIEYNNLWQDYRDKLEYSWKTAQNALDRENELARQILVKQGQIEVAKMQVEVEKMKALGNLAATALDKTGALKAAGDFLFGSSGPSGSASAGSGAVGGVVGAAIDKIKQVVTGSTNTGYTQVTKPNDSNKYWTDGKTTLTLDTRGDFYVDNILMGNYSGTTGTFQYDYSFAGASNMNPSSPSLDDFINAGAGGDDDWMSQWSMGG
jgi:hypothetical protein